MNEPKNRQNYGSPEHLVECHYRGAIVKIPDRVFFSALTKMQYENKKFIRYKDGAALYSMSERSFYKLAHDADAIYKYNKIVLVNIAKIDDYLEFFRE